MSWSSAVSWPWAYDFVLNTLGWWQEVLSTLTFSWGQAAAAKYKLAFSLDNDAALLGIGYFTGLRYAAIIAAGSFFSWFVCIPVVYYLGGEHVMTLHGQAVLLADAPIDAVFSQYVRHIGIGMLAMAGIIGLVSMSGVRRPGHPPGRFGPVHVWARLRRPASCGPSRTCP